MGGKYRWEYKYRMNSMQAAILEVRATSLLQTDPHAGPDGSYRISSLYFDDSSDSCLRENEDGCDPRFKFRLRYYGENPEWVRLEKKSRKNGRIRKDSAPISLGQCRELMAGKIPDIPQNADPSGEGERLRALLSEMQVRNMKPKVIVSYDRKAYVCSMGNVRITFDQNITSSNETDRFLEGVSAARPILPKGESLLEVKWDELLPSYIREQMALDDLQWSSFSKYRLCRMYHCGGGVK